MTHPNIMQEGTLPPESQWPEYAKIAVQGKDGVWVFGTYENAEPNEESGGWNGIGEGWWYPGPRIRDTPPHGEDWKHAICRRSGQPTPDLESANSMPPDNGLSLAHTQEEEDAMREVERRAPRAVIDDPLHELDFLQTQMNASLPPDPGHHCRKMIRRELTPSDIQRGFITVTLDPYRICALYRVGGGPREHVITKALIGPGDGQTERDVIHDLRAALERWEDMLDEENFYLP